MIKIEENIEMAKRKRHARYFRKEGNYMRVRASHKQLKLPRDIFRNVFLIIELKYHHSSFHDPRSSL